jgi:hypothetical protein
MTTTAGAERLLGTAVQPEPAGQPASIGAALARSETTRVPRKSMLVLMAVVPVEAAWLALLAYGLYALVS